MTKVQNDDLFEFSTRQNMESRELFENDAKVHAPLAELLRPKRLEDFVGQAQLLKNSTTLIQNLKDQNYLPNLILWGPPGTGKTTFAKLLAEQTNARFISCNAIDTGAKELREIGVTAHRYRIELKEKTILFVDEIHRLNKSQQDVLLPFTESGDFSLVGATTENPSYELNAALLSRSRVLIFEPLEQQDLQTLIERAAQSYQVSLSKTLDSQALEALLQSVAGDARQLLNTFEAIMQIYKTSASGQTFPLQKDDLQKLSLFPRRRYDKKGDGHYDTISAFIKSVRGSDPDAAIYYLARMIDAGEDPVFIARRLVILASEDIGNADPRGLSLAVAGLQAVELVGMPEARICLAQVTSYLASAPKSNRAYVAINEALEYVKSTGALEVPLALRSAQNSWVKKIGYGEGYKYSHDYSRGYAKQQFLPDEAKGKKFYEPSNQGFEKQIQQYLNWLHGEMPESK
jgi:putative ATPase